MSFLEFLKFSLFDLHPSWEPSFHSLSLPTSSPIHQYQRLSSRSDKPHVDPHPFALTFTNRHLPLMHYDRYGPHIGPAAMPSPHSRHVPYFSGHRRTLEGFLKEFKREAYDCRLTDPQQVDALVSYVDPYIHDFCRSLDGFPSCDWHRFWYSLIKAYGTPRGGRTGISNRRYIFDFFR